VAPDRRVKGLLGLRHLPPALARIRRSPRPVNSSDSPDRTPTRRRILIVYDCIYPWSIGGAERWYRALAERLAAAGHDVTYLSLRQWEPSIGQEPGKPASPDLAGVRVVEAGPNLALYAGGRRRLWPPLRFGLGVLWHLLRHGRRYDIVHAASFPYWPLLAAALVRPLGRYGLVVDWWEVWTLEYWRDYAGPVVGTAGWLVQRTCVRLQQRAFCFSRLHAERLRAEGLRGPLTTLRGVYTGPTVPEGAALISDPEPDPEQFVLYAGRHIPEKRLLAIVAAMALARDRLPGLRAVITGDGPERARLQHAITAAGLDDVITLPGFVDEATLRQLFRGALCFLLPSRREGYGLVVVEAAAHGTPSVVVAGPDNAATELIVEGTNGVIAPTASALDLASAILRIDNAGPALRQSTAAWFAQHAEGLSLAGSLDQVQAAYHD
jgi:glycosyltransferase involved in cell wall biosynthesis